MSLKIIFMGTPQFAAPTLQALVEAGHNIVAVYTAPPKPAGRGQKETLTPVHQLALRHELRVLTPASLKDTSAQTEFKNFEADAAIVAAYGLLLPQAILDGTGMGCLNIHPSLLPRWRGAAPIQRCVMAGDKETGIVIMQMNAGLDTGDMLLTKRYDIPDGMNAGALHDVLSQKAGALALQTLEGLITGKITPMPQPEEGIIYAKKITKEEARINWHEPATTLRNKVLGLSHHPGAYFIYKGENIKILDADTYPAKSMFKDIPAGTVIDNHLTIVCRDGALAPMIVQRPGKKVMPVSEMLKGYAIAEGTVLE